MDLFTFAQNIYKKDYEKELIESIGAVQHQLKGLVLEQTCKVYSSFLFHELTNRHVPCRLISTLHLGFDFEHWFLLIPHDQSQYFLVDLTYQQFGCYESFFKLFNQGYQVVDNSLFQSFLSHIPRCNSSHSYLLNDVYFQEIYNEKDTILK